MKYILLPIHPEWCCKLMNGDKETEVRRRTALYNAINNLIKEQGKAPCLIYCTQGNGCITSGYTPSGKTYVYFPKGHSSFSGKVIAQFEASAEEIFSEGLENGCGSYNYSFYTEEINDIREKSCLDEFELCDYLGKKRGGEVVGTAIHVKRGSMRTNGFPKNLSDYGIKRAPQSFMYVEAAE